MPRVRKSPNVRTQNFELRNVVAHITEVFCRCHACMQSKFQKLWAPSTTERCIHEVRIRLQGKTCMAVADTCPSTKSLQYLSSHRTAACVNRCFSCSHRHIRGIRHKGGSLHDRLFLQGLMFTPLAFCWTFAGPDLRGLLAVDHGCQLWEVCEHFCHLITTLAASDLKSREFTTPTLEGVSHRFSQDSREVCCRLGT